MAKRRGDVERAAALWLELVHDPLDGVAACEHLAIYYERNARDLQRAVEFAQLALAKLQRQFAERHQKTLAVMRRRERHGPRKNCCAGWSACGTGWRGAPVVLTLRC